MTAPDRSFISVARGLRAMFIAGLALLASAAAFAQATGTLTGRVTDTATQLSLAGTRVSVRGTGLETYTNSAGDYVLTGVPVGAQTVEFGYIGYGEQTRAVEITAGATSTPLPGFPNGLFVAMSNGKVYHYYSWDDIAAATGLKKMPDGVAVK